MKGIKKIVALASAAVMSLALFAGCAPEKAPTLPDPSDYTPQQWITNEKTEFDEDKIVLSFAAFADTHQQWGSEPRKQRLTKAINLAKEYAGGYLDAITVSGDITNRTDRDPVNRYGEGASQPDIVQFKNAVEEAVNVPETSVIYCLGNHDNDPQYTNVTEMAKVPGLFKEKLGENYFKNDVDEGPNGCRHAVVNGFHFIGCNATYYWKPDGYTEETKQWVLETLVDITSKDPNKPIFVLGHAPEYGTTLRSSIETWYDKDIGEIMRNFPQCVYIAGHVHNVIQDERFIMQEDFTALTPGSVHNEGINLVYENEENTSISNLKAYGTSVDNTTCSCLLLQVDENNNVRVLRIDGNADGGKGSLIKQPCVIPAPQDDLSHLIPYSREYRVKNNSAPYFKDGSELEVTKLDDSRVKFSIPAAKDDDMIYLYRLESNISGSETLTQLYWLSPFYHFYKNGDEMVNPVDFIAEDYEKGKTYDIRVYAVDVWFAESQPLEITITI